MPTSDLANHQLSREKHDFRVVVAMEVGERPAQCTQLFGCHLARSSKCLKQRHPNDMCTLEFGMIDVQLFQLELLPEITAKTKMPDRRPYDISLVIVRIPVDVLQDCRHADNKFAIVRAREPLSAKGCQKFNERVTKLLALF